MRIKLPVILVMGFGCLLFILNGCKQSSDKYTRGVGIYPGNKTEDFSPSLVADNENYRNLAFNRAAFHSSSYDYNLTAQLATDGIIINEVPDYVSVSTNKGVLPKNEREWLLDHNIVTALSVDGTEVFVQIDLNEGKDVPQINSLSVNGSVTYDEKKPGYWQIICSGSGDGVSWNEIGKVKGTGFPGYEKPNPFAKMFSDMAKKRPVLPVADSAAPKPSFTFNFAPPEKQRVIDHVFKFKEPVDYHFYKVAISASCAKVWTFGDFYFFRNNTKLKMAPSASFRSAWMSAGTGEEWICVDLGSNSTFDNIKLHWINKAVSGSVQVSDDAKTWNDVAALPGDDEATDDIKLSKETKGRFVKILMTKPASDKKYILSELEVFGKGGLTAKPKASPAIEYNRMMLNGGNWKISRASEVSAKGEEISQPGGSFNTPQWVIATVPGTVLVSYWNAGALPDPNFGDNQLMISESFFYSDFWYRNEFDVPASYKGERMFLNFYGINWKADIWVNGKKTGRIDGAFIRGIFDVTDLIKPGEKNAIAVLIIKNDNIGVIKEKTAISTDKNGGVLGADNPTYHASVGWDWIPTIRGRNTGIWNDVFLSVNGAITIEDPLVTTDLALPDTSAADISIEVTLKNHKSEPVTGSLSGNFGDIEFEKEVSLDPYASKVVKLNSSEISALHLVNPKLWWPKGYGKQDLYDVALVYKTTTGISDKKVFKSGIREMSFDETGDILNLYINGRRFIGRGGNWGFPESNLQYRGREYDIAVALHADMNFTMIRNWVGQTGDDEFFDACDRYGVMVWQDFWLANPVDGPDPNDPAMFMANAADFVKRIRNHPSIGLYCGRNEGNPPDVIDTALRSMLPVLHPGVHYISNSAMGVVSGGGPYRALPVRDYFLLYGFNKFHSERGMPNVMTFESLQQMLPESALWPQNSQWGMHDYTLEGAQGAASFNKIIETGFGPAKDAREFSELAQWENYDGYRGMFEGRSSYRQELLLWMSHPCWPSMVWQTYDYYFDPTAAYFGCKKASEPIHIQWNPVYDIIEVVNYNAKDKAGLVAKAQLVNMDGSVQWEKETTLDCKEDATVKCFKLEFPANLSSVHFIKLILKEDGKVISDNFYWRGLAEGNYQALRNLPDARISSNTKVVISGENQVITTTLNNASATPALMIRLKVIGNKNGERILPVFFSDNYFSLMPGESKVITMKLRDEDTRGEKPSIEISGFNL